MADSLSINDLERLLEKRNEITLLDVRRKDDFEKSPQTITGARWQDPGRIDDWRDTVPKEQDVVVYCVKGGPVSQSVAETLAHHGCRVKFLDGGIKAWHENGGAVD